MMKQKIKLNEKELKNLIMESIKEEMANENWWGRTFGGAQSRGNTQMADAMKLIQQSDQLIAQFRQSMQQGNQQQLAFAGQQVQGQQPQQVKESEANEVLGTLMATATGPIGMGALAYGMGKSGANFLGGKGDKNFELAAKAYKLRSDAYNFIARAVANGVPVDLSTFKDDLLGVTPQNAQAAANNKGGQATNWKQAEAEINQVVKGNFQNWPQQCRQAGWPEEKIQAYRALANANNKQTKGKTQPAAQPAQTQPVQAPAANTAQPAAQPVQTQQKQQVSEAIIDRVMKNFMNRR